MDGFQLGPIHIYWYSLCLLAAIWIAYFIALRQRARLKLALSQPALTDLIVLVLVVGVIGARFGYVVQNLGYFGPRLGEIFYLSSGGLSIHGAVIAAALSVWWYAHHHRLRFLILTDLLVIPLLVGQIIGRLGNYFNQELYGYPTSLPWKIFIAPEHRISPYQLEAYYQPTFLYEMILNGIGLFILWRWQPKERGRLTGAYLIIFAVSRFLVEIFRIADRLWLGLSSAQIVSLIVLAVSYPLFLGSTNNVFKKHNNPLTNFRQDWNRGRHKEH